MKVSRSLRPILVDDILLDLDSTRERPIYVVAGCTFEKCSDGVGHILLPNRDDGYHSFALTNVPDGIEMDELYPIKAGFVFYCACEGRVMSGNSRIITVSFDNGQTWISG